MKKKISIIVEAEEKTEDEEIYQYYKEKTSEAFKKGYEAEIKVENLV